MATATYASPNMYTRRLSIGRNSKNEYHKQLVFQTGLPLVPMDKLFPIVRNPDEYKATFSDLENKIYYKVVGVEPKFQFADVRRYNFLTDSEDPYSPRIIVKIDPAKKNSVTEDAKRVYETMRKKRMTSMKGRKGRKTHKTRKTRKTRKNRNNRNK